MNFVCILLSETNVLCIIYNFNFYSIVPLRFIIGFFKKKSTILCLIISLKEQQKCGFKRNFKVYWCTLKKIKVGMKCVLCVFSSVFSFFVYFFIKHRSSFRQHPPLNTHFPFLFHTGVHTKSLKESIHKEILYLEL